MPSPPDVGVVVVAAGRGQRAGGSEPKQFRALAGARVLERAVAPFVGHPRVARVVVVLPAEVASRPPAWLAALASSRVELAPGGPERIDSVAAGLARLPAHLSIVLVHDGARPFPDVAVIDAVIHEAGAGRPAIAAVPVSDTLKEARVEPERGTPLVVRTLERVGLWRAQTPQGFPRALLERGLVRARAAGLAATDDAAVVEPLGVPVVLVPDVATNLKITTPADWLLAEALAGATS